jgi:hypothetical protein
VKELKAFLFLIGWPGHIPRAPRTSWVPVSKITFTMSWAKTCLRLSRHEDSLTLTHQISQKQVHGGSKNIYDVLGVLTCSAKTGRKEVLSLS